MEGFIMETRRLSDLSLTDLIKMQKILVEEQRAIDRIRIQISLGKDNWKRGINDPEWYIERKEKMYKSNELLLRRINAEINNFIDSFRTE